MNAWPVMPGVPAMGHVTGGGFWHPGKAEGCTKCAPPPKHRKPTNTNTSKEQQHGNS